nr:MAG TPA: hypothetical protein [Caudoviricetes sp.]
MFVHFTRTIGADISFDIIVTDILSPLKVTRFLPNSRVQ